MLAVCSHKFKLDVSESLRLPQTSVQLSELAKLVHLQMVKSALNYIHFKSDICPVLN